MRGKISLSAKTVCLSYLPSPLVLSQRLMRLRRLVLARRFGVAHVGAELGHVHPAVAVELDDGRVVDIGIRRDQLHAIAGGSRKRLASSSGVRGAIGGFGEKSAPALS